MARHSKPTIDDELIDPLLEGREHSEASAGIVGRVATQLFFQLFQHVFLEPALRLCAFSCNDFLSFLN